MCIRGTHRARHYNPALGRFLSQDSYPVNFNNPVELNRYVYGLNNPSRYTDLDGHRPCELVCEGDRIDWIEAKKGSAWYGDWDIGKQKANEKKAEAILYGGTEIVASVLSEAALWEHTGGTTFYPSNLRVPKLSTNTLWAFAQ